MAKRTPKPQADDTAAAPAAPARARRATRGVAKTEAAGSPPRSPASDVADPSDTHAARAAAGDQQTIGDLPAASIESQSMASEPSEEDIRLRAYHRFLARGGDHGADFEDWLEAERELKRRN